MSLAREVLTRLLSRAEKASFRDRAIRDLVFSEATVPEYLALPGFAQREEVHLELLEAQRQGAISVIWDPRAGDRGQVARVTLVDRDTLAGFLGVTPVWTALAHARAALTVWGQRPAVEWLLRSWEAGKTPRGRGPDEASKFVEALRVIERCEQERTNGYQIDKSLRRFSTDLFGDSKRIDALAVELDLLTRADFSDGSRSFEEVCASLGLAVHPQPFLMSGPGITVRIADGHTVKVLDPYLALAPQSIAGIDLGACRKVLTVENLDTYHEIALKQSGEFQGLLLYTAGMPSPAWIAAYKRVMASCRTDVQIYHWGDTDTGGVRILTILDDIATEQERKVVPWMMGKRGHTSYQNISGADAKAIAAKATKRGWGEIASHFSTSTDAFEQQSQELLLPD